MMNNYILPARLKKPHLFFIIVFCIQNAFAGSNPDISPKSIDLPGIEQEIQKRGG